MSFAEVAIAVPLRQTFTYKVPERMNVDEGSRVLVPFGRRSVVGIVMRVQANIGKLKAGDCFAPRSRARNDIEVKQISEALDTEPIFSPKMVKLLRWMADYYFVPIGDLCRAALPSDLLKNTKKKGRTNLQREAVVENIFNAPLVKLSDLQYRAYNELKLQVSSFKFQTTLLHGITGSGKTEVYMRLFDDVIKAKRQVIFLVPEIGMTPQAVGRIISRFGDRVACYHSALTDATRRNEWGRIANGEADIVIGTRSAIFAPVKNLGLIVIDEEHDPSYKQEENPRYNGRDVSVMRAKMEGVPCILGSATPSVESYSNVKLKKYHYIHLPERPTGAPLPSVQVIDMKEVGKGSALSPFLISELQASLGRGEQVMLFLNRRGFASFVLCPDCGGALMCPNCNITLASHKNDSSLMCHYCDYKIKSLIACPKCGSRNLRQLGTGTERIEEEVRSFFPAARIERFDRDVTSKAGMRRKILTAMKRSEIDILIGTQMITKGHDFENVTLVGILDADMSLNFPDFRAAERTFQLLTQMAGRSGRAGLSGKVIIQTYSPEHYAIKAAELHDFFRFFNEEMPQRKELCYPPFGRLAMIKISGLKEGLVERYAGELAESIRNPATSHQSPVTVLGPTPAPISRVRNRFRWHILVKSGDMNGIRAAINGLYGRLNNVPSGIKVAVDVDPVNML